MSRGTPEGGSSTVGGVPLVHHQMAALAAGGDTDGTVVVGPAEQQVRAALGDRGRYVVNPVFGETNGAAMSFREIVVDDHVVAIFY